MNRIVSHLRGNAVAYLALFVALGGSSYAAFTLPANSVGTKQLRNHSITPIKLDRKTIGASVRALTVLALLIRSPTRRPILPAAWPSGPTQTTPWVKVRPSIGPSMRRAG